MIMWLVQLVLVPMVIVVVLTIASIRQRRGPWSPTNVLKVVSLVAAQTVLIALAFCAAQLSPMVFGGPAYARSWGELLSRTTWLSAWEPASVTVIVVVVGLMALANLACVSAVEIVWSSLQVVGILGAGLSASLGLVAALYWHDDAVLSSALFVLAFGTALTAMWTRVALLAYFRPNFARSEPVW